MSIICEQLSHQNISRDYSPLHIHLLIFLFLFYGHMLDIEAHIKNEVITHTSTHTLHEYYTG